MPVAVAFKARNPEVLTDYFAAREAALAQFRAKVSAFEGTVDGRAAFVYASLDGGLLVLGFHAGRFGYVPAGWKLDGTYHAVPAKRTAEGRTFARELHGIRLEGNTYPGAPNTMYAAGYAYGPMHPKVDKVGGSYYLTLPKTLAEKRGNTPDPEIWEPVEVSELLALQENENKS